MDALDEIAAKERHRCDGEERSDVRRGGEKKNPLFGSLFSFPLYWVVTTGRLWRELWKYYIYIKVPNYCVFVLFTPVMGVRWGGRGLSITKTTVTPLVCKYPLKWASFSCVYTNTVFPLKSTFSRRNDKNERVTHRPTSRP